MLKLWSASGVWAME